MGSILRLQRTIGNRAACKLLEAEVSQENDPLELEADRAADTVMRRHDPSGEPPPLGAAARGIPQAKCACAENGEEECETCRRKRELVQRSADGPAPQGDHGSVSLAGGGSPLPGSTRAFMEQGFGTSFADVRVHTGEEAATAARDLSARAFTIGNDIAFARNAFRPQDRDGQHLLAHELAHVVQQRKGGLSLQRNGEKGAGTPAPLATRVAAFQRLVKEAGKLRMTENSRALDQWRDFLQQQLTPAQVQGQVHAEEVRSLLDRAGQRGTAEIALAEQWLQTAGPNRRWVMEQQIEGKYRACSGCHATVQAEQMDRGLAASRGGLLTPLQQLPFGPDQGPRPSFAQGEQVFATGQAGVYPGVAQAQDRINAIQPYLRQLGPAGYRVLPPETLGSTAAPTALLADIGRRISQRQADYRAFIRKIDTPGFDYLDLRPIVRDLLPLAEPDVRKAVQDAIESAETWETIESVVVGLATVGLLLLAVFPPTSAIGIGGAMALGGSLAAHQIHQGYQSYEQGRTFSLAKGAHDVLDPAQQEAADSLMAVGVLNMVLGSMGLTSSALGSVRLVRHFGTLQKVEAKVGGEMVEVTGWNTRDPRVVIKNSAGQVRRDSPASSFGPAASARARNWTPSGASGGSGGYVFPTQGGAARLPRPAPLPETVPQALPEPIRLPVPKPAAAPAAAAAPVAPDVRGLLAAIGGTSGLGTLASAGASPQPVMPAGLSPARQELWRNCSQQHDKYKATQAEAAAYAARMDPIRTRLMQNQASLQERIDFCAMLDERIKIVQRLHSERLQYMKLNCDQFDWFNSGTTEASRLARHQGELDNVATQLRNFYDLRNRLCP